jgi:EKC/KEOPS complex subunit PCC1/LAGE3
MNEVLKAELSIPFVSARHANIALTTLSVDEEPRKELIQRKLHIDSADPTKLNINWTAKEAKLLRVSVNSFFEQLISIIDTINTFNNF